MSTPIATPAVIDLTPRDLDNLVEELRAYHALYSPLFQRREQREWAAKYLHGLRLELPRKSIEPLVLALEGAQPQAVRAMQQFLSEGSWDDTALLHRHWQEVDRELGEDDGVLILDGSDFPKQGFDSVGVKRQYGGELGKRANGHAGVFLGYASRHGDTLLDRRLYLPQEWVTEAGYAERRRRCGVPADIAFTTQPLRGCGRCSTRCSRRALCAVAG
jgi:SRSO17 transposase